MVFRLALFGLAKSSQRVTELVISRPELVNIFESIRVSDVFSQEHTKGSDLIRNTQGETNDVAERCHRAHDGAARRVVL